MLCRHRVDLKVGKGAGEVKDPFPAFPDMEGVAEKAAVTLKREAAACLGNDGTRRCEELQNCSR